MRVTPPSPSFHTPPAGGRSSLDRFNVQWTFLLGGSSSALGSNSGHASHESLDYRGHHFLSDGRYTTAKNT
ncbi:hypothetical protein TNCV_5061521 [Trichonephila clavipes]|nr:hypothetical protein TNCV_5061521 [Trichonephila clavipes]